ncbi:MAG: hypothetical protein JO354_01095, partial [Verrucomicrobia bacterium]|nr:hypothetical protein [Verrucomicrobiota bacterium]
MTTANPCWSANSKFSGSQAATQRHACRLINPTGFQPLANLRVLFEILLNPGNLVNPVSGMPGSTIRRLTARDTRLSSFRYYDLLVHIFVVILLISNLVGQKICIIPFIHLFGHIPRISGAQLLFPLTYIFADVFTEVYGY